MYGSNQRVLAQAFGAPDNLQRFIDITNRAECADLKLVAHDRGAEHGHRQTWESGDHLFEAKVTTADLNLGGTLFGGNTLGWMQQSAQSLIVSRIPNLSLRDIATHRGSAKFSLPVFAGDMVRFYPHLAAPSGGNGDLDVRIDMLRMHGGIVELAATSHWNLSIPEIRQAIPDPGILRGLASAYGAAAPGASAGASNRAGVLLAWLDLAVTQAAFNFALSEPRSSDAPHPEARTFATRSFEFNFYPTPGSIDAEEMRVNVIPDRRRPYDYHVHWSLLSGGGPIADGIARIIDVERRKREAVPHPAARLSQVP